MRNAGGLKTDRPHLCQAKTRGDRCGEDETSYAFKHERKDQPKDGQTGQSERLGNACFPQQLPDL